MNRLVIAVAVAASLAAASAAAQNKVSATLASSAGNNVAGTVTFMQEGGKVIVIAEVTGLKPGPHGFHVHEKGDCSAPDFTSAGGHFNPGGKPHGDPAHADHHAGDMPMLVADASGKATLRSDVSFMSIGGADGITGRAVVVHADPDDFKTQPAGNSGPRVACGVIK
ncbi:MAG: superoxide dismutase family protein [Burkholderiales bacterium]